MLSFWYINNEMSIKITSAKLKDLPAVISLADLVFRPKEKSMGIETPLMWAEENVKSGNLFVVKEDNRILSLVGLIEEEVEIDSYRIKIGNIGNVCTHPDYRGRGYATSLLQEAIKKAKRNNLICFMISGGRGLYRRLGAVGIPFYYYEVDGGKKSLNFKVVRYKKEFYESCMNIYKKEKIRFIRKKNFSSLFSLYNGEFRKKIMGAESRIYVIIKNGEISAYWAEGKTKDGIIIGYKREFAGDRKLLITAWKSLKGKRRIFVPIWDKELIDYLGKAKEIKEMATFLLINHHNLSDSIKKNLKNLLPKEWRDKLPMPFPMYGLNYA